MAQQDTSDSRSEPRPSAADSVRSTPASSATGASGSDRDQLGSYLLISFGAIFLFLVLYIYSVQGVQALLEMHFRRVVANAIRGIDPTVSVTRQIQSLASEMKLDDRTFCLLWCAINFKHECQLTRAILAFDAAGQLVKAPQVVQ